MCQSGGAFGPRMPASSRAAGILRKAGRSDVFNLGGGLQSWRQAGLPVVK